MSDASDHFGRRVELKVAAAFGSERDAERVAQAAVRLREAESVEWSPSFVADRMTAAPKDHTVPEKWNWLLERASESVTDAGEYALDSGELAAPEFTASASDSPEPDLGSGEREGPKP